MNVLMPWMTCYKFAPLSSELLILLFYLLQRLHQFVKSPFVFISFIFFVCMPFFTYGMRWNIFTFLFSVISF